MSDLGTQVGMLLNRRFNNVVEKAGAPFLKEVFEAMNQLTSGGRTFRNLTYDNRYRKNHKTKREKLNYQTSYVDLRMSERRIEKPTPPNVTTTHAEIGFISGGDIFYAHHFGEGKGGIKREIFPKVWLNVPDDIKSRLFKRIAAIMNGRNV